MTDSLNLALDTTEIEYKTLEECMAMLCDCAAPLCALTKKQAVMAAQLLCPEKIDSFLIDDGQLER
jgi:hypothetical protein